MNFFNKNKDNDLIFLELKTKLNLVYWIICDADHYVTNYPNDFNEYEYEKILDQYQLALRLFHETEDVIALLSGDHKKCLQAIKLYVGKCLVDFRLGKNFEPNKNSEQEEIELLETTHQEEIYMKSQKLYLLEETFEFDLMSANEYVTKGSAEMMFFLNSLDFTADEKKLELLEEMIDSFMSGRIILETSLKNRNCHHNLLREFMVMTNENLELIKDDSFKKYFVNHVQYMRLWHETILLHERFCKSLFDEKDELNLPEFELFSSESIKYYSCINKAAIEVTLQELEFLGIKIPHIEIYSARKITSPIEFLQHKLTSQAHK